MGRHEPDEVGGVGRHADEAKREEELAARERLEHLGHRLDARFHVEQALDVVLGEDEQAHRNKPRR